MPESISFNENAMYPMLRNKEEAINYLSECLADEDPRLFLLALRDLVNARGIKMTELARQTGIQRAKLYRILSLQGNPEWRTIRAILQALGIQLNVKNKATA